MLLYLWALCSVLFSSRVPQTMWSPGQRKSTSTAHLVQLLKWQALTPPLKTPVSSPCKPVMISQSTCTKSCVLSFIFSLNFLFLNALIITLLCFSLLKDLLYGTQWWAHLYSAYLGVLNRWFELFHLLQVPGLNWQVLYWPQLFLKCSVCRMLQHKNADSTESENWIVSFVFVPLGWFYSRDPHTHLHRPADALLLLHRP